LDISPLGHGWGGRLNKMATFEFPNGTTPDEVLIGVATVVPTFSIMILVFTWMLIFLRGSIMQSKRAGYADMAQWATLASLACVLLSLVMTVKEGLITLPILLIVMGVTTLSAIWFFMSRGRFE